MVNDNGQVIFKGQLTMVNTAQTQMSKFKSTNEIQNSNLK